MEQENFSDMRPYHKHYFSFITQNDSYFDVYIDRYYTAGHGFLYSSKEGSYAFLDALGFVEGNTSFSVMMQQKIYTPKNKQDTQYIKGAHPYGGYLGFGFFWHHRLAKILENLGITIGVSGKSSLAYQTQDFVHRLIGSVLFQGWHSQLASQLVLNLYYDWNHKYVIADTKGFSMDLISNFQAALGSANIYLKGGFALRIGRNFATTFLPQGIIGENGGLNTGRTYRDGLGYYIFLGTSGGYIARKLFIEGNLFDFEKKAELIPWIGGFHAGIVIVSGRMSFAYQAIYTTKEFRKQDKMHGVGSFNFAWSF